MNAPYSNPHYPNYPTPPAGRHPRVFVTAEEIPAIRQKLQGPRMKALWEQVKGWREGKHQTEFLDMVGFDNFDEATRQKIESNALLYLLENNREAGLAAVEMGRKMVLDYVDMHKNTNWRQHGAISRQMGLVLLIGALVYDWCYDLLTPEHKKEFVEHFVRLATKMEIGYPPRGSAVTGHSGEAELMRNMFSAAIAIYDEFPEMYHAGCKLFFKEFVPARNFFYPSHFHHQGDSYGPYRFHWEMYGTWLFARMGYSDIFVRDQGQIPYQWIYTRRPDLQLVRDGDTYYEKYAHDSYWGVQDAALTDGLMMAASFYQDPYLQDELIRQLEHTPYQGRAHLFYLILGDLDMPSRPIEELPLTRLFGSPMGTMVARTDWSFGKEAGDLVAYMKVGEMHFANHMHLDSGQFQLYYKGPLAIDSGLYSGKDGQYASPHWTNYYQRTIAHNSLLIYDPNETFNADPSVANDGGQRWPNFRWEARTLQEQFEEGYEKAKVVKHWIGPDAVRPAFSYLKGDLTKAYTAKVDKVERSFVFMNFGDAGQPGGLVVFDRVQSAQASYRKYWLLHTVEEPAVNGSESDIKLTKNGYSGRMKHHTLLPEQGSVEKVGGPGHEFDVFGTNYANRPNPYGYWEGGFEAGEWRIQVSPAAESQEDLFLNVLLPYDAETEAPQTAKVEFGPMVGARVHDRIVLFSKSGEAVYGTVQLDLTRLEDVRQVLVTDLAAGHWRIVETSEDATVTEESGVIHLNIGSSRKLTLVKTGA